MTHEPLMSQQEPTNWGQMPGAHGPNDHVPAQSTGTVTVQVLSAPQHAPMAGAQLFSVGVQIPSIVQVPPQSDCLTNVHEPLG